METKILKPTVDLETAATLLKAGELVAFPTETVYGLGAIVTDSNAVQQVYRAKGRPSDNPLIVHLYDWHQLENYVEKVPATAIKLAKHFWPGSLTLILPIKEGTLSPYVTGGLKTAAFRVPNHPWTLKLLKAVDIPLVGPSANSSGKPSPTTAEHVYHDLKGKIAAILDGGATTVGIESTVLDLSEGIPTVLRPGAITVEELTAVLKQEVQLDTHLITETARPKAPGMKYKHYAPNVPTVMVKDTDWHQALNWAEKHKLRVGVLASQTILPKMAEENCYYNLTEHNTVAEAMQQLFAGLRYLDERELALDVIFVQTFPATGQGLAYMNRLQKASGGHFYTSDLSVEMIQSNKHE